MSERLKQSEWDELSAFVDGELPEEHAEQVRRRVESDPAWSDALAELRALDARLEDWTAPQAPAELAERIIHAAGGDSRGRVLTLHRILAGATVAAAAAAVIIAVTIARPGGKTTLDNTSTIVGATAETPTDKIDMTEEKLDEFAVENLGFIRDYDVLADFETLRAIESAERVAVSGT